MNSAIVLGATSMLGKEVCRQLSNKGATVLRAGRASDSDIVVDLSADASPVFTKPFEAEVLIHCAAAFGDNSHDGVLENIRVNISGCAKVIKIERQAHVEKIVYAGSVSSYPEPGYGAMTSYGFSKAEAERILDWHTMIHGKQFCSLRFGQLWDTEGRCCAHQPWFGRIIAYASRGLPLNMPPASGPRNFMHISDAANLLIEAADSRLQGIHAACHPTDVDMHDLARAAYVVYGKGGRVSIDANKPPFRKVTFHHGDALFKELGVYPKISLPWGVTLIRDASTSESFGPLDVD